MRTQHILSFRKNCPAAQHVLNTGVGKRNDLVLMSSHYHYAASTTIKHVPNAEPKRWSDGPHDQHRLRKLNEWSSEVKQVTTEAEIENKIR